MHRLIVLATVALLVVILLLFVGMSELRELLTADSDAASLAEPRPQNRELAAPGPSAEGQQAAPASVVEADSLRRAEQRVRDLETAVAIARQRLVEAEDGLAASEAEVEELEQMIAEIKARGEDPAAYADLAMERFQPAFFRFQDAQAAYDNAERLRAEAESALAAARAELARRRSALRTE